MRLSHVILVLISALCVASTQLSQKYLQDTIMNLKSKTNNRPVINRQSQPTLNTLQRRRVYTQPQEMTVFAQSHAALSTEVDKIMDNVVSMISAASDDKETVEATPPPQSPPTYENYQEYQQPGPQFQGSQGSVPSLQLTKAELAALYANAVHKGDTIQLDAGESNQGPLTAAVHEVDETGHQTKANLNAAKRPDHGYYYYYYPLKSFRDDLASPSNGISPSQTQNSTANSSVNGNNKSSRKHGQFQSGSVYKSQNYPYNYHHHHDPYYHSHLHQQLQQSQHNVRIEPTTSAPMMADKKKGLEPLFMAISGFIGMTVMFILSVLVLPKFKKMKPKEWKLEAADEEFYGIGRVALEAIDGFDCSERFACEAGKTANALGMYNNRFVKFLRRIGPYSLVKQINRIGKYTNKKYRCAAIRCKQKPTSNEPLAIKKPPVKRT